MIQAQRASVVRRGMAGPGRHLIQQDMAAHAPGQPHGLGLAGVRSADGCEHHHDFVIAHRPVDMVDAVRLFVPGP